jgi:lipopolysaccharide biosynthesis protein
MIMLSKVRLLAFYLPQFHPVPENDAWWGDGFTEWSNVRKARPLFPGHYQPHIPADLGYYDLRSPETRQAQADLAREYGIYGFCYYHYWFNGKRLLELPFKEVLDSGKPDFPFCLCWANESWTRVWDGGNRNILMAQTYSEDDDRNHVRWLIGAFQDHRYIRVDSKPLFLVYRASHLPDPHRTTDLWREEASKAGVGDLYLCRVESFSDEYMNPRALGFDAAVEFQPDRTHLPFFRKVLRRLALEFRFAYRDVYDYAAYVKRMLRKKTPPYKCYPCVMPMWDNSPRRKTHPTIFHNSTPERYEHWLRSILRRFTPFSSHENLVFVNAWNEWGESNHLEPCQRWGRGYLEATRSALASQE